MPFLIIFGYIVHPQGPKSAILFLLREELLSLHHVHQLCLQDKSDPGLLALLCFFFLVTSLFPLSTGLSACLCLLPSLPSFLLLSPYLPIQKLHLIQMLEIPLLVSCISHVTYMDVQTNFSVLHQQVFISHLSLTRCCMTHCSQPLVFDDE